MTPPMLIGLCGYKRAGKSTVASLLAEGWGFRVESFAAPIRRAVADILGMSEADLEHAKATPLDWLDRITPRKLMQTLGTEWGRAIHRDLWVLSCMARIAGAEKSAGGRLPWVIHDVRFSNEAGAIRDRGGVIVRVDRGDPVDADDHASEQPLPDHLVDYTLDNSNDFAGLLEGLIALVNHLQRPEAA